MPVLPYHPAALAFGAVALSFCLTGAGMAQEAKMCGEYPAPVFPDLTPVAATEGIATIATPFGDVDLPTAPTRALGMYTTDVDILMWLGFPLAKSQPIRGDNGYEAFPCFFPEAPLAGVGVFANFPEYNYEAILAAGPDFILNGLGYDADVVERLPQIAPTFSVDAFDGRSWREHFKETATALGRLDRYEAWRKIYEARVAEVKEAIRANADAVVAPVGYWGGKFNTSCYVGVECSVLADLGLKIFEPALANNGEGLVDLSGEQIGQLQGIDFAFTSLGVGEAGLEAHRQSMAEAAKNPLWAGLDFVKNDRIVPFEIEMVYGSPSGQLAFLEVVAKALAE